MDEEQLNNPNVQKAVNTLTIQNEAQLKEIVDRLVYQTEVTDMHTHLFSPDFGDLNLWGVDELLIYHYLISETFRWTEQDYASFWEMSKTEQADWVWKKLFVEHSPISEAARGVITIFNRLGLDTSSRNLNDYRAQWAQKSAEQQVDDVMAAAKVKKIVMTNDPFDDKERAVWTEKQGNQDSRFYAALRVDPIVNQWDQSVSKLNELGYDVSAEWETRTIEETRRFLSEWIERMDALYLAISMPGDFSYPSEDHRSRMIDDVIIPVCQDKGIPFGLMIGVKRQVNPQLRLAGDMSMRSNIEAVQNLCNRYPDQKFLVTMLSRENQHELTVLARKFRNLMVFGCWWFLHIESMVEEMTRFRLELLGTSFIPQHSDCRVFEQLVYKWEHSRKILANVLNEKYATLMQEGWVLTEAEIQRDVEDMLDVNFWRFLGKA
ncbi:glucuronate isomerase [Marinicrinis sediminis]|uniref:Glucuronate isomerase n=1 Tax=Marinicrinis sediminis TaxID=1652465 RepID=A0ABW5R6D2_9BACL